MKNYRSIKCPAVVLVLLLVSSMATAQRVFRATPASASTAEAHALSKVFKKQTVIQLDAGALYNYVSQSKTKSSLVLEVGSLYRWDMDIELHDLRSPDFVQQRTTENGTITLAREDCHNYAGMLKNDAESYVRLNLYAHKLSGVLRHKSTAFYLEPLRKFLPSAAANKYVLYKAGDSRPTDGVCGASTPAEQHVEEKAHALEHVQAADCRKVEVATETDWEGFAQGVTFSDIIDNLNLTEPLFSVFFGAQIIVKYQHEWGTFLDPYTSTSICADGTDRLDEFRNHWQANFSWTKRDINIMYSGVDFTGNTVGCAFVGVFAGSTGDNCYTVVQWNDDYSEEKMQVLVAHEVGHIFGCQHDTDLWCSGGDGPIMCPSLGLSCHDDCSPYWSPESIVSISASMTSSNGSYRMRNREFFQPLNTATLFGFPLQFNGNDLYIPTTNTVTNGLFGNGSITFLGTDIVTLQPGFTASVAAGPGYFLASIGTCIPSSQLQGSPPEAIAAKQLPKLETGADAGVKVFPNPIGNSTRVAFHLEKSGTLSISVYDLSGRLVDKPVTERPFYAGPNAIQYNSSRLLPNVYMMVIEINGKKHTQKLVKL